MAESKRTGLKGTMNKDLDDRLVPEGFYRDALNISVGHSEGSDVGAIENLRGNSLVAGTAQDDITGSVIGSVVDSETGYIYYFVSETDKDVIYEHNPNDDTISIVLIDGSAPVSGNEDNEDDDQTETPTPANFTVTVDSFTLTENAVSSTPGQQTYNITLVASATSTSDAVPPTTRTISTYNFQEYTDNTYTTLETSQPGTLFNTEQSASTLTTTTTSKSAATRYFKVTATDENNVTGSTTAEISITAGTAALNFSVRSLPNTIVQGSSFQMQAYSVSGGVAPYSYSWTGPNGFSASTATATVTSSASSSNNGTYTCTVTDSNSPTPSTLNRSVSKTVTSVGVPVVITSFPSGETEDEMQFNGSVTSEGSNGSVTSVGFYYIKNTTGTPFSASHIISNGTSVTASGSGTGPFSKIQGSLDASSTYDVVAWAYNGVHTGYGGVESNTTDAAGVQSITFSPTSLSDKPNGSATYAVTLSLNNLPDSLINVGSTNYITGGSNWITSVVRRTNTNIFDISFAAMTVQSPNSPTNRVASISFTNPTTNTSATLSCSQTLNASIALSGATSLSATKISSTIGLNAVVAFDPDNQVNGAWGFFDTLPSWITPQPNSNYYGSITGPNNAISFTLSNNNSGAVRYHTFDARLKDGNQNNSDYYIRDTITVSQSVAVTAGIYEFQNTSHSNKTQLTFYRNNGSFQQALFSNGNTQGNNTNDNVLRMTVTPTGTNASEITSVQYKVSQLTGADSNPNNPSHFLINGNNIGAQNTWHTLSGQQGGSFNLTITAPTSWGGINPNTAQIIKTLQIRATSSSGHVATQSFALARTA